MTESSVAFSACRCWSSYNTTAGALPAPAWLNTEALLSGFGKRRRRAQKHYEAFVADGVGVDLWAGLRGQIYLGGEEFVETVQGQTEVRGDPLSIPQQQRRAPAPSLDTIGANSPDRDSAIFAAHETGAYSYRLIAEHFGLHPETIGRIVRRKMLQGEA